MFLDFNYIVVEGVGFLIILIIMTGGDILQVEDIVLLHAHKHTNNHNNRVSFIF